MWYIYIYIYLYVPFYHHVPNWNQKSTWQICRKTVFLQAGSQYPSSLLHSFYKKYVLLKKQHFFLNVYVYVCVIHMYVHKCTHIYIYLYHARYVGASKTCKNNEEVFTRNWLVISSLNHPTLCQNSLTRTCVKTGTLGSSAMTSLETSAVP